MQLHRERVTTLFFCSVVMRVIVTMFSGSAAPSQLNTVLLSHDELFTLVCLWCAFLRLLWLLRVEVGSCLCGDGHATCLRAQAPPKAFSQTPVESY